MESGLQGAVRAGRVHHPRAHRDVGRRCAVAITAKAWPRAGSARASCGTFPARSGARCAGACRTSWLAAGSGPARASSAARSCASATRSSSARCGGIVDSRGMSNPARRAEMFFQKGFPAVVVAGPHRARIEERTIPSLKPGEVLVRVSLRRHLRHGPRDPRRQPRLLQDGHGRVSRSCPATSRRAPLPRSARASPTSTKATAWSSSASRAAASARSASATRPSAAAIGGRSGVIGQDGAYAAYLVTRARYVHKVPDAVSLAQAALAEPLAVVIKGLRRLGSQPHGDRAAALRGDRRRHHRPAGGAGAGAARAHGHGVRPRAHAPGAAERRRSPTSEIPRRHRRSSTGWSRRRATRAC